MIDLDNFYKFEVGVGTARENNDVRLLAYVSLPDGKKVVASHNLSVVEVDTARFNIVKTKLNELLVSVMLQVTEEINLHEQHEEAN